MLSALLNLFACFATASTEPGWERLFAGIRSSVFEVVLARPADTGATYFSRLPLESVPLRERRDSVWSIGTAFAVGKDTLVTASHVLWDAQRRSWTAPMIRDQEGHVHRIGRMLKFSNQQDFAMFLCPGMNVRAPLRSAPEPRIGQVVHAVGNALGEGIVLREGLLTSRTPEEAEGAWSWLRFSAAASPGNSGGPLLDAKGHLLGVVLAKSQAENLNYALPWKEVVKFPAGRFRFRQAEPVVDPFLEGYSWQEPLDTLLQIPQEWNGLKQRLDALVLERMERQSYLLRGFEGDFPSANHTLVTSRPVESTIPLPLYRDDRKRWVVNGLNPISRDPQEDGGLWAEARWGDIGFAHFRLPDSVGFQADLKDSRRLGEAILRAWKLERNIANLQVRVSSLGAAVAESTHVDRWGRRWSWRSWRCPWNGAGFVALVTPQPCGFSVIVLQTPLPGFDGPEGLRLRELADLTMSAWHGTSSQWKTFLADENCPPMLRELAFETAMTGFDAKWSGCRLVLPREYMLPGKDVSISVYPGFRAGLDRKGHMEIGAVHLTPERNAQIGVSLARYAEPGSLDGDVAAMHWKRLREGTVPFDGTPISEEGGTGALVTLFPNPVFQAERRWVLRLSLPPGTLPLQYRKAVDRLRLQVRGGNPDTLVAKD
jgi:serine protease Do